MTTYDNIQSNSNIDNMSIKVQKYGIVCCHLVGCHGRGGGIFFIQHSFLFVFWQTCKG